MTGPPPHQDDADLPSPPGGGTGEIAPAADGEQLVELNALLGRGTRYSGKLHFQGRVRIEGRFSGEIRGEDILVIGDGAEVDGLIEVGVCIVTGGQVRANIRAREGIELHVPAVVVGDLHAPAIFIDRGVQFEGSCKMAPLTPTPPEVAAIAQPPAKPLPPAKPPPPARPKPTIPQGPPPAPPTDPGLGPSAAPPATGTLGDDGATSSAGGDPPADRS